MLQHMLTEYGELEYGNAGLAFSPSLWILFDALENGWIELAWMTGEIIWGCTVPLPPGNMSGNMLILKVSRERDGGELSLEKGEALLIHAAIFLSTVYSIPLFDLIRINLSLNTLTLTSHLVLIYPQDKMPKERNTIKQCTDFRQRPKFLNNLIYQRPKLWWVIKSTGSMDGSTFSAEHPECNKHVISFIPRLGLC